MEGCSKYCSFCVVPYTRGEEMSRGFDEVIAEIVALAEQGVQEVTLLGQNVNAYRGPTQTGDVADLATLLYYAAGVDGIERMRFTTSHPLELTRQPRARLRRGAAARRITCTCPCRAARIACSPR